MHHTPALVVIPCDLAGAAWAWRPATPGHPAVLLVDVKLPPGQRAAAITAVTDRRRALQPIPGPVARVRGFAHRGA